ncbi:MAG: DUF5360 family protein [Fibrobacterota bacterium]|nr:DUF5360 family protein [Fibrobacterota bacterium]QQS07355.1 MAG: DUF5360 family protein [Fibrobacterota bacterium]
MPSSEQPSWVRVLLTLFVAVDTGFVLYWCITALHLLPPEWLYKDHANPLLVAWNWSFLPLDLAISATGYLALAMWKGRRPAWRKWAIVSLALTSASGLQAVSFWAIRSDFDPFWWAPNLFLLAYPWVFLPRLVAADEE